MSRRRHPHRASHRPSCYTADIGPVQRTPVRNLEQALAHVELLLTKPLGRETAALFVDEHYLPLLCIVVEGVARPDDVLGIADLAAVVGEQQKATHVFLVTSRPGQGFEVQDVQRWFLLDHLIGSVGVELLEWFVCNEQLQVAVSPLAGEPSRWPDVSPP